MKKSFFNPVNTQPGTSTRYRMCIWCLLFGVIISPTDPPEVLAIIKSANAPKSLEFKLVGNLFNDGSNSFYI